MNNDELKTSLMKREKEKKRKYIVKLKRVTKRERKRRLRNTA
jgi:hypothetical protein